MANKTTAEKKIEIPSVKRGHMVVTIKGDTPLIVHRFGDIPIASIENKQQMKAKVAKGARDPKAEFLDSLHVIDEEAGVYGFPAAGIKKALISAGYRLAGETMTVLRAAIFVHGELLEIKGSKPTMRRDVVRIDKGGTADVRYRPQFWPWEIEMHVTYLENVIRYEQVYNLFELAGLSIGIGDWRQEKNGWAGSFSIKEARIVE